MHRQSATFSSSRPQVLNTLRPITRSGSAAPTRSATASSQRCFCLLVQRSSTLTGAENCQSVRKMTVSASAAGAMPAGSSDPEGTQGAPSDPSDAGNEPGELEASLGRVAAQLSNLFPLWVGLASGLGLLYPPALAWFRAEYTTAALALTMLAMGTSLTFQDFADVMREPKLVLLGAGLQYTIMPLLGFTISRVANLSMPLAIGICIVASCPGGTASNLVTYLAQADVALSVTMTTVSTLLAVVATPLLTQALVGAMMKVSVVGLLYSTLQVVLVPVGVGACLNQAFPRAVRRAAPFSPLVCVVTVALLVGSIIANQAEFVRQAGWKLLAAVASLHAGGFLFGYVLSRAAGAPERAARTNSIEVGMQNSALGAFLALAHFPDPLTAVPCAISACTHSLMGSAIAGVWRWRDIQRARREIGKGELQ
mmetsp:Transcript_18399/g.55394  ORF Transcript_18399/g.55394 Transcript_18399/m.55394 type:complete len:425 (+) Transcript_18399:278-1552(+)